MKIYAETDRIILREIILEDAPAMFEMDRQVDDFIGINP